MALADGYYNTHRFAEAAAEYREVIRVASDSKVMQAVQAAAQAKLDHAEQRAKLQPSGPAVQARV